MSYKGVLLRLLAQPTKLLTREKYYSLSLNCGDIVSVAAPSAKHLPEKYHRWRIAAICSLPTERRAGCYDDEIATKETLAVVQELKEAGVTVDEAMRMQHVCDHYHSGGVNPAADRYLYMAGWLSKRVQEEEQAAEAAP